MVDGKRFILPNVLFLFSGKEKDTSILAYTDTGISYALSIVIVFISSIKMCIEVIVNQMY